MSNLDKLIADVKVIEIKETIRLLIKDSISDLLYYNRKECEEIPLDTLENALLSESITVDDMTNFFRQGVTEYLDNLKSYRQSTEK